MCESLGKDQLPRLYTWLRQAGTSEDERPDEFVLEYVGKYQVVETVEQILGFANTKSCNIALQFPDELLHDAPFVAEALRLWTEQVLAEQAAEWRLLYFILGDTSYGECCVDEVAAAHLKADLVVHYGNACLSPTNSLPALYVFPSLSFERPQLAVNNFTSSITHVLSQDQVQNVIVLYDTELYECFRGEIPKFGEVLVPLGDFPLERVQFAKLRCRAGNGIIKPGPPRTHERDSSKEVGAHMFEQADASLDQIAFLWFSRNKPGDETSTGAYAAALQLCTGPKTQCPGFYIASLTTGSTSVPIRMDPSKLLRKRLAPLSAAKDAERIGIVPGTLGVSGGTEVIDRCKRVIKAAGKRAYVILFGKPNPAKLANFPEIDVFVLVACPQNALLDGREYLRPVVTPLELEAALLSEGDIFSSPYSTDFRQLLSKKLKPEDDQNDQDLTSSNAIPDENVVATRGDWSMSVMGAGGAGTFLKSRLWQGLSYGSGGNDDEADINDLEVVAVQGQTGIASKYDHETKNIDR